MAPTAKPGGDPAVYASVKSFMAATKRVQLALKLGELYAFENKSPTQPLSVEGVPRHSWTTVERPISGANWFRQMQLVPGSRAAINMPLGVTAVIGPSGSGKTYITRWGIFATAAPGTVKYFRVFEPPSTFDEAYVDAQNPHISIPLFEITFASELAAALLGSAYDVIILDSLRYLFYGSSSGSTGKGGVNMSLFTELTHLDSVAKQLGKRIVVVINPLTNDTDAFDFYVEAARGAVAAVLVVRSLREIDYSVRGQDRTLKRVDVAVNPTPVKPPVDLTIRSSRPAVNTLIDR